MGRGVSAYLQAEPFSEDPANTSCQYIINPFGPPPVYFFFQVPHILAIPTS